MLYLAGQILVFVLLAMIVGAALAWLFLIAPLRRQGRAAASRGHGGAAGVSPNGGAAQAGAAAADLGDAADISPQIAPERPEREEITELIARLRRQEERWAMEKADLSGRLAGAERQVVESEQRVAAAERQVASAQSRISEIEAALRAVPPAPAALPSVAELARETASLRTQLEEAEDRAAKFSSRLAVVRTDAEQAQRQVATMSARLDQYQAEWAAERTRLLARIAEAEEAHQAAVARVSTSPTGSSETEAAVHTPALSEPALSESARSDAAVSEAEGAPVDAAPVDAEPSTEVEASADDPAPPAEAEPSVESEPLAGSELVAEAGSLVESEPSSYDTVPLADPVPSADAGRLVPPAPTVPAPAPALTSTSPGRGWRVTASHYGEPATGDEFGADPLRELAARPRADEAELVGAGAVSGRSGRMPADAVPGAFAGSVSTTGGPGVSGLGGRAGVWRPDPVAAGHLGLPAIPSWGGPAEPVHSTDNLKEIVGIGPVIEARLHVLGVTTFRQLAAMGDADVDRLARKLDGFGDRIVSDDWVGQARDLQARHHGGLA